MCNNGNNSGSGNCSKQAATGSSDYINSVVRQTPGQMSVSKSQSKSKSKSNYPAKLEKRSS
ncbi:GM14861 [Drosophila sechellia]|uniref:GM14861 n=1 Tax=Drosophila sechellia TaxID=7238 RepID=B4HVA0_DROSE|nr:GM14861 [Drosophila sechellia]